MLAGKSPEATYNHVNGKIECFKSPKLVEAECVDRQKLN